MLTLSRVKALLHALWPSRAKRMEAEHWNQVEARANAGQRQFWVNHPRIWHHYYQKSLLDGLPWRRWLLQEWGGPGDVALELGCGDGAELNAIVNNGVAMAGVGYDLDVSRFAPEFVRNQRIRFVAEDLNTAKLEPDRFDLVYALQSFHHFEALDHIMEQVHCALTPRGYFVLDEFVGPARFQWTDLQLSLIDQILGIMPKHLRMELDNKLKVREGRSTPEHIISACPSEAVRSDEIVEAFYRHFEVVHHKNLGGTLQHLVYARIVQNFPDNDPEIDHLIDCVQGIEATLIEKKVLESDFVLLVGRKRRGG